MQPFPERLVEIALALVGMVGILVLIAPNFGQKPKQLVDGWRFPVKPTCLLLYYLALCLGIGAVAVSAFLLLSFGTAACFAWLVFAFGFAVVPFVLADWPEPLILDGQGLLEGSSASRRIRWRELTRVELYSTHCDSGIVIEGAGGKKLFIPDIAYDSRAVLERLSQWQPMPCASQQDETLPLSILSHRR
jgi:hypothetical protein